MRFEISLNDPHFFFFYITGIKIIKCTLATTHTAKFIPRKGAYDREQLTYDTIPNTTRVVNYDKKMDIYVRNFSLTMYSVS